MDAKPTRRFSNGFTLVELMVTLAVATILIAVAVPAFGGLIASNRLGTAANELSSMLALSRDEAIRRGRSVTLCRGDQGGCDGDGDWASGWVVFVDADRDQAPDTRADGSAKVLRIHEALKGDISIQAPASVTFRPTGRPQSTATVTLCSERIATGYRFNLSRLGNLQIEREVPCS